MEKSRKRLVLEKMDVGTLDFSEHNTEVTWGCVKRKEVWGKC